MGDKNKTLATEFILLGFTKDITTNIILFMMFFVIYLVTCVGNGLIISIIIKNHHLHTPMYFFLCNLSFIDLFFSSSVVPKLLVDLLSTERVISISACKFQEYSTMLLGGTECLLLALMAYDRYVAICCPLYYSNRMSWRICYQFAVIVWTGSFLITIVPTMTFQSPYCNPNHINHFMCDALGLLKLSCKYSHLPVLVIFWLSFILLFLPFILITVSYICIISSILKIDSIGRAKAFSTCSSHLTVVILFYDVYNDIKVSGVAQKKMLEATIITIPKREKMSLSKY
ncbi:olfactory receptor 2D3-like [Discoglossus pictus]